MCSTLMYGTGICPPCVLVNCISSSIDENEDLRENNCHSFISSCSSFKFLPAVSWRFLISLICCIFPCAGGMRRTKRIRSPSSHFVLRFKIKPHQATLRLAGTLRRNYIWVLFVSKSGV